MKAKRVQLWKLTEAELYMLLNKLGSKKNPYNKKELETEIKRRDPKGKIIL